jgi:hypothetical protein
VHPASAGDRSVLHSLQHQRIWVGGTPMDAPEQRIAEAQVLRGLGTLEATSGQQEPSCAALSRAIELYRAMAITLWLPEVEAALAQVEGR